MANKIYYGTGHRKSSIAKVRMTSGKGNITINGRDVNEYLPFPTLVMDLKQPLEATNTLVEAKTAEHKEYLDELIESKLEEYKIFD